MTGIATSTPRTMTARRARIAGILATRAIGSQEELGQALALTLVMALLMAWRAYPGYVRHAFATNTLLMCAGFLLLGYQLSAYVLAT